MCGRILDFPVQLDRGKRGCRMHGGLSIDAFAGPRSDLLRVISALQTLSLFVKVQARNLNDFVAAVSTELVLA